MTIFLAYFQYAIVLALSVRLSVRLSVTATSLQGIDQFCLFMAQSIAYEPGTCLKEGIFLGQSWNSWEGFEVQIPLYF
jgi:hypothetical protein